MIPELYFMVALFTGGIHQEYFKFAGPIFLNEKSCITYVKKQFKRLNLLVNKKYKANRETPNLFFCITDKEFKDILESGSRKKQSISLLS
jgi:hypothetical protein